MKKVDLSKQAADKVRQRVPWLYRNELPRTLWCETGETAMLVHQGEYLATAFINPESQIAARILCYDADAVIDADFIARRIRRAAARRKGMATNALRLVHAEADGLPGLVVDRYGEYAVFSVTSAGMERFKPAVIETLRKTEGIKGINEKADAIRQKEGLKLESGIRYGTMPESFIIEEGDKRFLTDLLNAQKTGFFLDQRRNRRIVGAYGRNRTLDLFANAGGFGIYADARHTTFVEISAQACELIARNCELNKLENVDIVQEDVFAFLEKEKNRYDLIIVDPPAFAKNKKAKAGAMRGWKYLIDRSLRLLEEEGHIALFSCSHAIDYEDLLLIVRDIAAKQGNDMEIVELMRQDRDHPHMLHVPNSLYLTGVLLQKRSKV
jgi:23S rRNA (cytosine1962-C5)-methyltransferase